MTSDAEKPASVPAELVEQWWQRYLAEDVSEHMNSHNWIANCAAAYGREQAQQWTSVADEIPKANKPVFIFYRNVLGKGRSVKGFYCGHHERSTDAYGDFEEGGDWSDDGEVKYWPAGWYESIENWEDYSAIAIYEGVPTHWMPLPDAPTC